MLARIAIATQMGFREQARRPLFIVLLVATPFILITWSFYITEPTLKEVFLPGDNLVSVTMKELHGAVMVPIAVGFLAGLSGLFIVQSARDADKRLVVAGYRASETIIPRLSVLLVATLIVLTASIAVTALDFIPTSWFYFVLGNLLAGLIYGTVGALSGALFGKLGAAYFMFFMPMMDLGIAQNPMFGDGVPTGWATLLPGYGPMRIIMDGAFSTGFDAAGALAISLGWIFLLAILVVLLLRRAIATKG